MENSKQFKLQVKEYWPLGDGFADIDCEIVDSEGNIVGQKSFIRLPEDNARGLHDWPCDEEGNTL